MSDTAEAEWPRGEDDRTQAEVERAAGVEQDWYEIQATATLAEALAADRDDLSTPEARQAWSIDGDNSAVWALRKLAAQRAEIARIDRDADAEILRIKEWAEEAKRGPERAASFFEAKLIDYRRRLEAADPKLPKTYKLPAGTIAVRAGSKSVKVTDKAAFVEWAADNRLDALTLTPRVSGLADLPRTGDGELVGAEGEVVPGVIEVTGDPTYTVKPTATEEMF